MISWRFVWRDLLIDNGVFHIYIIEVSFLVGFLAYVDSLILGADLVEVPTSNFEAVDTSWGPPKLAFTSEMI